MPDVTPLSPELSRSVLALARSLVAASRTWSLYPPEHPAVRTAVDRLGNVLKEATGKFPFTFGVTPDTLLLEGVPATGRDSAPITEAASWLHHRDILQITFVPEVPPAALEKFLALLAEDPRQVRERGGPAKVWQADAGHPSILLEQIDFSKVLEERDTDKPVRTKDDLWKAIVRAVLDRRKTLDESIQKRLLEIAGDVFAIGDLAQDVMAPNCSADGSPMLTSQAAAVVAAYRHLVGIVDVLAPERRAEVMGNLASATASLDPRVVMQILSGTDDAGGGLGGGAMMDVRRGIADAFDDTKVAQLLATTLAIDGQASDRLASVFDTIAPDDERKQRVLTLTRSMLGETSFGKTSQFQTLWTSMEELLLSYNERPFVSEQYRESLDTIGSRGGAMAADIPPELAELVHTLDQENVRRLSITLLVDLLNIEKDPTRAPEIAKDVAALGEDLLLAGDYTGAVEVTRALGRHAADSTAVASAGARVALDGLVNTAAFHESVNDLNDLDDASAEALMDVCKAIGPPTTDALRQWLDSEKMTRGRQRATALIRQFGAAAVGRLAPLVSSKHWYAQRNAADLLGEIASPEGVPLLQPLLRGSDGRVTQAAVRALSNIDDPSAARAVHTVLRAAAGHQRQAVVAALVAERDPRVVPLLVRILDESEPFGDDHPIVLETPGAVAVVGGDEAIPAVDRVIRKRKWFARQKVRAVKQTGVRTLRQIDTPAAKAALDLAGTTGDRLLRRFIREAGAA
jgi:HEAT repeat protein